MGHAAAIDRAIACSRLHDFLPAREPTRMCVLLGCAASYREQNGSTLPSHPRWAQRFRFAAICLGYGAATAASRAGIAICSLRELCKQLGRSHATATPFRTVW